MSSIGSMPGDVTDRRASRVSPFSDISASTLPGPDDLEGKARPGLVEQQHVGSTHFRPGIAAE
jgi:hypothetical protein